MNLSPLRRRRARPAGSRKKVILCACLGLGAQTVVPAAEAWISTATPTTARGGTFSDRIAAAYGDINRWGQRGEQKQQKQRRRREATCTFAVTGGSSSIGGWGTTAPPPAATAAAATSALRQQSASAFSSSRASLLLPARPFAIAGGRGGGANTAGFGAGWRGGVAVRMSMAEESGGNNAMLGALAVAGVGAVYYALHTHTGAAGIGGLGSGTGPVSTYSASLETVVETAKRGPAAATSALQGYLSSSITKIDELGPLGAVYFGLLYVLAEVLIIPALPLTTAAGFLFGVAGGTAVVLTSACVAAAISFQLGRTLLRSQVEDLLDENPKFRALDKAIAKEGFKVILLLRLSPIFPFALSNYLYGVTSVDFVEYISGTLIGFLPGTVAYVYGGTVGKELTDGSGLALPWYGFAAAAAGVLFILKTVGTIATNAIEEMEEESDP